MQFAHLKTEATTPSQLALVRDSEAVFVSNLIDEPPRDLQDLIERGPAELHRIQQAFQAHENSKTCTAIPLNLLHYDCAVLRPPQIIAIGANYAAHASELHLKHEQAATIFSLWPNSLSAHNSITRWPASLTQQVDYEGELGVIIGKSVKNVSPEAALDSVFGYTIVNDITARDLQFTETQWSRCKSFDGFTPTGPVVVTADEIPNPQNLWLKTNHNGTIVQNCSTSEMIRSVAEIISYLSICATLPAGTFISTGSPSGAGYSRTPALFLTDGCTVTVSIENIGTLKTHCQVNQS